MQAQRGCLWRRSSSALPLILLELLRALVLSARRRSLDVTQVRRRFGLDGRLCCRLASSKTLHSFTFHRGRVISEVLHVASFRNQGYLAG
ncbi:hypothetical protein LSAT2_008466 [Lamellibrachia satsuma]|nr:hypothetical protein LSAT2_008466 [Lamellibrachia satsuma]